MTWTSCCTISRNTDIDRTGRLRAAFDYLRVMICPLAEANLTTATTRSRSAGDAENDAKLIALCERLKTAWAVEREAFARDCSNEEGDAVHLACSEIADQIENIPATTLAGLQIKAAAIT